jgi:hypothetical protein
MESILLVAPVTQPSRATNDSSHLTAEDPAIRVMTDFRRAIPAAIDARSFIDDAVNCMNRLRVDALLVKPGAGVSSAQRAVGLITYYDIERCRLHRCPSATAGKARVHVEDAMTWSAELSMLSYESLRSLKASNLYERFQGTGLTHMLVIETLGIGLVMARGLVSRAALTMRLHRPRVASATEIVTAGAIACAG